MKIGVAGLGAMGAAVAGRHLSLGNEVTVWNRTPDKAKPLADAGAKVVKSPAEVAAASDTVVTLLTDGAGIGGGDGAQMTVYWSQRGKK